jgi:hypothetical protein
VEEEVVVVATAGEGFEVFAGLGWWGGGVSGVLSTEEREGEDALSGRVRRRVRLLLCPGGDC